MSQQPEMEAAEQLPEGAETVPQEVNEELQSRERRAWEQILDRVAQDPEFKQKFLDEPQAAIQELGVEEDLDVHAGVGGGEVAGQWYSRWYGPHRHWWGHRNVGRWVWHYHHGY